MKVAGKKNDFSRKYCSIPACKTRYNPSKGIYMHMWPTKYYTSQIWQRSLKMHLKGKYVCSLHFKATDYIDNTRSRKKLKLTAKPSRFASNHVPETLNESIPYIRLKVKIGKLDESYLFASTLMEDSDIDNTINENEEILLELDECLHGKEESIVQLKNSLTNLENEIRKCIYPENTEKPTVEHDVALFRSVASKYVKQDLVDFYVERMRKSAANKLDSEASTISALCEIISKNSE